MRKEKDYPYLNSSLPVKDRVADLLSRLTLDEKIHMLTTHHCAVERLGIGEWFVGTECARGYVTHDSDKPSTVFPQPIGMASTFDEELMYKIGDIAGDEFRAYYNCDKKGGLMVWGPTVDMERDPRWGRTEEAYGEDPFLTGKMSAAYTRGLRGNDERIMKTIPTLKHFCANNNERGRGSCSANLEPRTKHEYYYAAFKPAVTEGGAYSVMAAYNELSGVPAICNPELNTIVKDKWGLGFAVSDGGDFSQNVTAHGYCNSHAESLALCLKAGCDVMTDVDELVCPAAYEALEKGLIDEADIDRAVGNSLEGRFRLGEFDGSTPYDNISAEAINCGEFKKVNLRAAREGVTLLKNSGILPLCKDKINRLLICGPLADENHRDWYTGYSSYEHSVLDGFKEALGEDKLLFDSGYDTIAIRSVSNGKYLTVDENGAAACTADSIGEREVFEYRDLDFDVINIFSRAENKYLVFDGNVRTGTDKVFQWFTTEIVHRTDYEGYVTFSSRTHDEVMTDKNGRLVCRPKSRITREKLFEIVVLSKGADRIAELAARADTVIFCGGNHPMQVARECWDRPDITLPKPQSRLVKAAFEANPRTIMLIVSSYPFAVNYENSVLPAIVYTSHAGPELGTAAAECLLGEYNPAGRTPVTWYKSVRELPDITDYDIIKNKTTYLYYDGEPLYPFGHGLSYSRFEYSGFEIKPSENPEILTASINVKNVSERDGDEVVQIYFHAQSTRIKRPIKQLCGFKRINIAAGETVRVKLDIKKASLEFWDVSRDRFCVETGDYTFMAGASSADIRESITVSIEGESVPPRKLRQTVKAINYDDKGTVRMLWSKRLGEHFVQCAGYTAYLKYQNCEADGFEYVQIKASSWEKGEKICIYTDSQWEGELIAEAAIPPTDGIDSFKTLTVPVRPFSGIHDIIVTLSGGAALLEFRMI